MKVYIIHYREPEDMGPSKDGAPIKVFKSKEKAMQYVKNYNKELESSWDTYLAVKEMEVE